MKHFTFSILILIIVMAISCFTLAGMTYIVYDFTPLCERCLKVGGILIGVLFITAIIEASTTC